MPQPNSDAKITSTPSQPGQPYDPDNDDNSTPPWRKLPAGPASINTGRLSGGDWPDSGLWQQC